LIFSLISMPYYLYSASGIASLLYIIDCCNKGV
jgi:hypothetical protein